MNGPLQRLQRIIARSADEVRAVAEEDARYTQCIREWNDHFLEDDWAASARAVECDLYIKWYEETRL